MTLRSIHRIRKPKQNSSNTPKIRDLNLLKNTRPEHAKSATYDFRKSHQRLGLNHFFGINFPSSFAGHLQIARALARCLTQASQERTLAAENHSLPRHSWPERNVIKEETKRFATVLHPKGVPI